MNSPLPNELRRFREENPDAAQILDTFEEIEGIYHEVLEAMGVVSKSVPTVGNSAEVAVSFRSSATISTSLYSD